MLRIVQMAAGAASKEYYTAALARTDYYVSGVEVVGRWRGRGAELLGLRDAEINQQTFAALADNTHPLRPEERLTVRTRTDRRVGYDLCFQVPKGMSLLHALTGDERLQDAFLGAVRDTMAEAEQSMQVRVRSKGETDDDRVTANWVYGEFLHLTARPVAGGVPDPLLHCHCTVLNASFDEAEGRWKAGQFGAILRNANYFEAAFHARLACAVVALGYRIQRHLKYWELADLPKSLTAKFAKRTALINETAKERGITNAKAKDRLGAATRAAKTEGLVHKELVQAWKSQLSEAEAAALAAARLRADARSPHRLPAEAAALAEASVDFAVSHLFERASVVSDRRIAEAALRHGVGQGVGVAEVWREIERRVASRELFRIQVSDQQLCTTREAYAETTRCIDYTRDGMGRHRALAPNWEITRPELLDPAAADQRAAIQHVLSSTDRVIAVQGKAGTGKTYATWEIASALAATGQRLLALAPTSQAADVLRKEGFPDADTVAQLLVNPQLQRSIANGVVLIDEAGLLSSRQLDRLFCVASDQNCRVILQYDLGQHRSVERGSPVRDLERYAGLQPVEIHVVRRQQSKDYKAAVRDLVHGRIDEAFARLVAMNAFVELADPSERQQRLASDYVAAARNPEAKVLVVSPTHREGDEVTQAIRTAMRRANKLKTEEHETLSLQRTGLTAAQRGESAYYVPGQIVQYTQNTAGRQRGERLVVIGQSPEGAVLVQRSAGSSNGLGAVFSLALDDRDSFEVYEPKRIGLSVGDRIRITANGYVPIISENDGVRVHGKDQSVPEMKQPGSRRGSTKKPAFRRLINNATYKIVRFSKSGDIVLHNGWVLPRGYGHLTYGYCVTSHASQGITADTVLISQSAESFRASSREQFYVSVSRGKKGIKIYTDSVVDLARAVARSDQQLSAADLLAAHPEGQKSERSQQPEADRRFRDARLRRSKDTALECAGRNSTDLKIKSEDGLPIIASRKRTRLHIGADERGPLIVTEDFTRFMSSKADGRGWVCGPHSQPGDVPATIPFKGAPLKSALPPATSTVSPLSAHGTSEATSLYPKIDLSPSLTM